MARILLGVTGGISAYKSLELVRLLVKAGHIVRVIQTPTSLKFVGRASFEALTGAPVLVDEFERDPARGAFPDQPPPDHDPISHLEIVRNADLVVVAPASANTLAKLAAGLADNLLTSALLACRAPVLVAPAMNGQMWAHPATVANLERLRERGVAVVEPETGALASKGEWGTGRYPDPARLAQAIEALAEAGTPRSMDGLRVLVTAGGTREPIDSVRFIGNRSSGRMGSALADEAARRGARVTLLAANVALAPNPAVETVPLQTAAELEREAHSRFADCDVLLMAAAVSDFRPRRTEPGKLGREGEVSLELEPTPDTLAALARERRPGQLLIGFAAEHGPDALDRARRKLAAKAIDAIVVNDISRSDVGFESDENEVTIVETEHEQHVPRQPKAAVAAAVLDRVESLRGAGDPVTR